MKINKNTYKLIDKQDEGVLKFYIKDNSIYYKMINKNTYEEEAKLIDNIKNYDITVDIENNIHLICITHTGKFYYFTYSNNTWKKTIIEEYDPSLNSIDYLNIISVSKIIHVLYSFRNIINKNLLKIVHYVYNDKWKANYLESISLSKDKDSPYFVDYNSNGDVFLLFKEEKELYLRIFSSSSKEWKEPKKIILAMEDIDIINFFVDSVFNIHLIYKNKTCTIHGVNNSGNISNYDKWNKDILVEEVEDIHSNLFEIDKKLYIIWKEKEFLYYKCSDDFGTSWMEKRKFKYHNICNIYYIGNKYKHTKLLKHINTFGNIKDNEISLVGIDDKILFCKEIVEKPIIEEKESLEDDSPKIIDDINCFRSNIEEMNLSEKNNETIFQKIVKYFNNRKEG